MLRLECRPADPGCIASPIVCRLPCGPRRSRLAVAGGFAEAHAIVEIVQRRTSMAQWRPSSDDCHVEKHDFRL
jgi:hypothetical protein